MNRRLALILVVSTVVVWLVACRPTPAPTPLPPTETPNPTATALPTPTTPAVEELQASAWVSHGRPGWGHVLTVYAKLAQGDQGVAGAQMYSIVHDADVDRRWPSEGFERTGDDGIASTTTIVMENPEGTEVYLDVYLVYEESTYHAQASFVSHC